MIKEINEKGEYALFENGKFTRYAPVTTINGAIIPLEIKPKLEALLNAAKKDGVSITVAVGIRTFLKQYLIRKAYVIDKTKKDDENYLLTAPSTAFSPLAAKPGYSKHQNGSAIDFNLTGMPVQYKWMIENAVKYGFIRVIPSEIWHYEYIPSITDTYHFVPKTDKSWII